MEVMMLRAVYRQAQVQENLLAWDGSQVPSEAKHIKSSSYSVGFSLYISIGTHMCVYIYMHTHRLIRAKYNMKNVFVNWFLSILWVHNAGLSGEIKQQVIKVGLIIFSILKEIVEISWLILVQCSKTCEMIVTFTAVSLFLNYNACNPVQLLYDFEIIIPLSAAVEPLYSIYVYVLSYNYIPFICFLIFNFLY